MDSRLRPLLKRTSRSFYLSVRILPGSIRPQIGLAYLLARATDTAADAPGLPAAEKREMLRRLEGAITAASDGRISAPPEFPCSEAAFGTAEGGLLAAFPILLESLRQFSDDDRRRIGQVLSTITSGQEMDLVHFGDAREDRIGALDTDEQLDDYTYRVAGCVGEFWTRMCRAHLCPNAIADEEALLGNGVRFGKGLQLVNILRDLPRDLRQGRCYIPLARLQRHALAPQDLLDPATTVRFRPLYQDYLDLADEHLRAGWAYAMALPRRQARVRLACLWPLLIGRRTLELLRGCSILDPGRPIRVSRSEVRRLMLASLQHLWRS